jgi:predicted HTH transcriptional regulator
LVTQGEQRTIEYKRQLPTSDGERANLARTVVAFANTEGGHLIYGVESDGAVGTHIRGVQYSPDVADSLVRIVRDRVIPDPGIDVTHCEVDGRHLVAVVVQSRPNRFFALNTTPPQFYVRRQANTFPATLAEIRELAATLVDQSSTRSWRRP